ncbi:glutamate dehydrogenase [Alicyclobacillus hesperidum subsp. aegles]|uniref:Glu/Leu/Phe/Val family dehydrogenase n=1 Tax=Alicyclobacillus hesperidum TaxID=89784 RepID=UPI00222AE354|nr:Glu/Leu/Phe/Val dehydrogenase [Alicyclobacillus hesperidum]GLG00840.1 glutamate dehydrogenase [Alicyclobacillus hesperidum subsp. aegles]
MFVTQSESASFEDKRTDGTYILEDTQSIIEQALQVLGYGREVYDLLKLPLRVLTVRFPVKMDDGTVKVFTGYRAQHNDSVGPTKGGIRLHPDLSQAEIEASAIWMSIRCGIADLPFGGGKGGIVCDPRDMSFAEIERVSRAYVRAISQIVGPAKDIPAPDVFSNSQNIAWMFDEYSHLRESDSPGFITGKPVILGGTRGRDGAAARGVAITIEESAKHRDIRLEGARVIVQGFGGIGSYIAKYLHDRGAKVVGVADAYGALYREEGLDVDELLERRDSFGTVTRLYRNILSNKELLEMPCDILIPAATGSQITEENASRIQASIIVEATNAPTTHDALDILTEREILVVPDVVSFSGDVIVSYFEWVQNSQGYYWEEPEVHSRLDSRVRTSFHRVYQTAVKYQVNMRLAAYIVGVQRLAEASRWRGWIS